MKFRANPDKNRPVEVTIEPTSIPPQGCSELAVSQRTGRLTVIWCML